MAKVFIEQRDGSWWQGHGVLHVSDGAVVVTGTEGELLAAFDRPLVAKCGYLLEMPVALPKARPVCQVEMRD